MVTYDVMPFVETLTRMTIRLEDFLLRLLSLCLRRIAGLQKDTLTSGQR